MFLHRRIRFIAHGGHFHCRRLERNSDSPSYFGFIEGLVVYFGVLGASIGLASLLSKYKLKALAWVGLIAGVLTVVLEYALIYLM